MSFFKKLEKQTRKALGDATKKLADVGRGVSEISKGNVQKGLGKITDTGVDSFFDYASLGNRKMVNELSGGFVDATKGVYRGNSKDIIRVGATVGAGAFGGPTAAIGVNQVLAQRGVSAQSLLSVGSQGFLGVDLFAPQQSFPTFSVVNDAGNYEQGYYSTQSGYYNPQPKQNTMPILIVVIVLVIILIIVLRK
jgi:hypothetical protein